MGSPRIKGNRLSFRIRGGVEDVEGNGVDYWADITIIVLDWEGMEIPAGLCGGGARTVRAGSWFDIEATQSTAGGSFWRFLLNNEGQALPFAYAPHGNPVPSPDQPHCTGVLIVPAPGRIGGAAGRTTEQTFEVRMHLSSGPYWVDRP